MEKIELSKEEHMETRTEGKVISNIRDNYIPTKKKGPGPGPGPGLGS